MSECKCDHKWDRMCDQNYSQSTAFQLLQSSQNWQAGIQAVHTGSLAEHQRSKGGLECRVQDDLQLRPWKHSRLQAGACPTGNAVPLPGSLYKSEEKQDWSFLVQVALFVWLVGFLEYSVKEVGNVPLKWQSFENSARKLMVERIEPIPPGNKW